MIWGMFFGERDWGFAQWILRSGISHADTNKLLDLKNVSKFVVDSVKDLQTHHRFKEATVLHSITSNFFLKRLMPFCKGQNGLASSLK